MIWMRPENAATGRPARHSRDEITAAAVAIADREGLDAVSMRRVAARLGTGAASLYRYLESREDLLDLMVDATGAEYVFTAPTGDWLGDLLDIGEQARAIMRRHPWLPPLLTTRPVLGPNGLVLLEHGLEALAPHPASSAAKLEALGLLNAATRSALSRPRCSSRTSSPTAPTGSSATPATCGTPLPPATARAWLNCSPSRHHLPAPALRRQPATRRTATATSSRGSSAVSSPHHRTPGGQSAHIRTPEAANRQRAAGCVSVSVRDPAAERSRSGRPAVSIG